MATTVNVSVNQGTPYTWDAALFQWNSTEANKPWDSMYTSTYTLKVSETIAVSEFTSRPFQKKCNESLRFTERELNQLAKYITENIRVTEGYVDYITFMLRVMENVTFAESYSKSVRLLKNEALTIKEDDKRQMTLKMLQSVNVSDVLKNSFTMPKFEAIDFAELASRTPSLLKKEILTIAETKQSKNIIQVNKELVTFTEIYTDLINFSLRILEEIWFEEKLAKTVNHPVKEALAIAEKVTKTPTKQVNETLHIAENEQNTAQFKRVVAEVLHIVEKVAKQAKLTTKEVLQFAEAYLRNANAVVSDIYFSQNDLSLEEFKSKSTPMGYTPFKDFVAGDLEYRYALIRLIMEAGVTTGRPQIDRWDINIDVPDTRDRGTVDVPATNFRINFNRRFFAPPEVNVTMRGGSTGIPHITSVDDLGFNIELRDVNTNQIVAGTITWSADGY